MKLAKSMARSLWLALAVSLSAASPTLLAQPKYPTKAVTVVTPWAVGGANDVLIRITSRYLAAEWGVPVNIVNRPGGNLVPGVLSVLKSAPDGYTLLSESPGSGAGHAIRKDLPYKWDERTFGPMFTSSPLAFVVKSDSPWKTLRDAVEGARRAPGSFTWGFLGGTANTDISVVQLLDGAGIDLSKTRPVPMAGSGPAVVAIAGGHIAFSNVGISAAVSLLKAGNLRVLAITSSGRMEAYPSVPTTAEAGFPDVNITTYSGISGPPGMPTHVVAALDQAAKKVTSNPAYIKELALLANQATYISSDDTRKQVLKQAEVYRAALAKMDSVKSAATAK